MIGIMGAMHEEIVELKAMMTDIDAIVLAEMTYFQGKLQGKDIVLVECGIGKVNSSICTTLLVNEFNIEKLIFTGVAGGIGNDIEVGDIVISTDLVQHDVDVTAFGLEYGVIPRMKTSFFVLLLILAIREGKVRLKDFHREYWGYYCSCRNHRPYPKFSSIVVP